MITISTQKNLIDLASQKECLKAIIVVLLISVDLLSSNMQAVLAIMSRLELQ